MALPLEKHKNEVNEHWVHQADIETGIYKLSAKLKEILKPNEWLVYENFYINNKSEIEIAKELNFKTTEKKQKSGVQANKKYTKVYNNQS